MKSQTKFNSKSSDPVLKPSLRTGVSYFILIYVIISCSTFKIPGKKAKSLNQESYQEMAPNDYADHLASLKVPFLSTPGLKTINSGAVAKKYVKNLTEKIISLNEIFFKNLKSAQVTILDIDAPLYFSLPKGEIFLSKGLISKYIKHESMLVSILAYELVRSENLLYPKVTVIPLGYLPIERMILLSRLGLDEKMEIHKWAHDLTIRSGFDGEYYLSWLQTQNRNTADFIFQVGDANLINREESLFKSFLIKSTNQDDTYSKKNSSKKFYSFLNSIRDQN